VNTKCANYPYLEMVLKNSEPTFQDKIKMSIERIFKIQWAASEKPPVRYQNSPFREPTNQEWIALTILESVKTLSGSQLGIVMFQIFTTKNSGLPRSTKIADMISPVFGTQTFTLNSDNSIVTIQDGAIVEISGSETGDGGNPVLTIIFRAMELFPVGERKNYFQLNARVPFVADNVEGRTNARQK